jgi:hypothetical protein
MSQAPPSANLLDYFSTLSDPRRRWRVVYPLPEILLVYGRSPEAAARQSSAAMGPYQQMT